MSAAAYNRGSRLVAREADERMPGALSRADRQAHKDEVVRLREQIATLERDLHRARRCLASERAGREALRVRLAVMSSCRATNAKCRNGHDRPLGERTSTRRVRGWLTTAEQQRIRDMIADGASHSTIAAAMGISLATVSRWRNRHA